MDLGVILGALIMLVGVTVGFVFAYLPLKSKSESAATYNSTTYYTDPSKENLLPEELSENDKRMLLGLPTMKTNLQNTVWKGVATMKKNLERVLELLREHNGPVPVEVGDEIEGLVQNTLDRMNPGDNTKTTVITETPAPSQP